MAISFLEFYLDITAAFSHMRIEFTARKRQANQPQYKRQHPPTETQNHDPCTASGLLLPAIALVTLLPFMLGIPKLLLHPSNLLRVARVFAHVVAELDSRTAIRGSNLDHDVEWFGLCAVGSVDKIVWVTRLNLLAVGILGQKDVLVKNVPTPKTGWNCASSAMVLYSRQCSIFSESENTTVFFSVMPSRS